MSSRFYTFVTPGAGGWDQPGPVTYNETTGKFVATSFFGVSTFGARRRISLPGGVCWIGCLRCGRGICRVRRSGGARRLGANRIVDIAGRQGQSDQQ